MSHLTTRTDCCLQSAGRLMVKKKKLLIMIEMSYYKNQVTPIKTFKTFNSKHECSFDDLFFQLQSLLSNEVTKR